MRKSILMFTALSVMTLGLTSCGSSMEKDAKEVSEFACKSIDLQVKAMRGDTKAVEETKKLETEGKALQEKFEKKYASEEDKKKFGEMVEKNLETCDAYKKMKEAFGNMGAE
ncbi:MAG TPA: hypothetical protein PLP27_01550 [Crocinitomicaceae bacterium]|nr:hypothetical protein [Crocinitomicaceae bacterium]